MHRKENIIVDPVRAPTPLVAITVLVVDPWMSNLVLLFVPSTSITLFSSLTGFFATDILSVTVELLKPACIFSISPLSILSLKPVRVRIDIFPKFTTYKFEEISFPDSEFVIFRFFLKSYVLNFSFSSSPIVLSILK